MRENWARFDGYGACRGLLPDFYRTGRNRGSQGDTGRHGTSREGTLLLAELGGKVLGTDALGWDRPFGVMAREFRRTGDPAEIWDGHFAGRDREVFIVQQLANLAALPPAGFTVGCFPLRLARASAAPARVVAFVPGDADVHNDDSIGEMP